VSSAKHSQFKYAHAMNPFFRSEARGLVFSATRVRGILAPSDSAAFDRPFDFTLGNELEAEWLRPRASRGELSS